jgi:hypothetical protein
MASATLPGLSAIHAYRHLYRALLQAVQFSKPARYVVKDRLRDAFRHGDPAKLDPRRICRTLEFLRGATQEKGLEHRILKSLVHTAYMRADGLKKRYASNFLLRLMAVKRRQYHSHCDQG